jgi:hypothetical protein
MMLPILISLSLAPGSYFFCALAVVASTAATANAATAATSRMRTGMVFSPLSRLVLPGVSQGLRGLASGRLFRPMKRPIVVRPRL